VRCARAAAALTIGLTGAVVLNATPAHAAEGPVVVSITFDDGLTSQWRAGPTLRRHGIRATYYLNSGAIDERGGFGTMSWDRAHELAAAGHEIGGHTLDHVNISGNTLTREEKVRQVCVDRARLVEQGFTPTSFAYPYGGFDATAREIVEGCGYASARRAGGISSGGPNFAEQVPPIDGSHLIRVLGQADTGPVTLQSLRTAVDAAYANGGGWVPMLFHAVCFPSDASYAACMSGTRPVDVDVLDQFGAWLAADPRPITAKTVSDTLATGIPTQPPPPADTTAPTVTIGSPAEGATLRTPTPAISGAGGRAPGDEATVTVRMYAGGAASGQVVRELVATVGANGSWSATPAALPDGTYTVRASQRDDAGNVGNSGPRTFTVDTAPPPPDVTPPDVTPPEVTPPSLTALSRTVVGQGARNAVIVIDGRFQPDARIHIAGKGVQSRITAQTARRIRLAVDIGHGAPLGARDVTVVNNDGGTATCTRCLRVVMGPRIETVSRDSLPRGRTTTLTVRGRIFDRDTLFRIGGRGARVVATKVVGPRRATISVRVAPKAPRTTRPVIVRNTTTLGQHKSPKRLRIS
jgi:peptidoglycan/xylan/chitin deacetylase (PgdA/CDA1 family)